MMFKKGGRTKKHLLETAAPIFNVKGFAGTSITEILAASGLEKGGLYRHFPSKDALALAAFDHSARMLQRRRTLAQASRSSANERLMACIDVVAFSLSRPAVRGGCPILNTTIEADDTHEPLRARAASAMRDWHAFIAQIVEDGVKSGELCRTTEAGAVASVLSSALEGALMVAALMQDGSHMERTADHLRSWCSSLARPGAVTRRKVRRDSRPNR